jgi:hypothetical protein
MDHIIIWIIINDVLEADKKGKVGGCRYLESKLLKKRTNRTH